MNMSSAVRWLMATSLFLVVSASAPAAQSGSKPHSHKPATHAHKSHPSHPMRNSRPKHHAMETTRSSLLAVRYLQPQQASSVVAANSSGSASSASASGHSSPASSKKKKSSKKSRHSRREPTQKAPTPDRISEIQSSLARGGYYQGEPNGKWDANTVAAMQKFQSSNGLDPSGKLDATSLQKLGLGSGIAGVSAPKPPCCSTAPAQGNSCCSGSPAGGGAPATSAPVPSTAPKPAINSPAANTSGANSTSSSAAASASSPASASAASTGSEAKSSER
jgi:peptidoglycan hydrolase-like protein with peptidoglycan-binding domain